jgi:primosomal protein N' (replication factor Y)
MPNVDVALNAPLRAGDRVFTFSVPAALTDAVRPGVAVRVPFGRQAATGFVVGHSDGQPGAVRPLEAIDERVPVLPPDLVALAQWMAGHYVCSVGEALWAMIPPLAAAARRSRSAAGRDGEEPVAEPAAETAEPIMAGAPSAAGDVAEILEADPAARILVVAGDERFAGYLDALRWAGRRSRGALVLLPEVVQAERTLAWVRRNVTPDAALLHGELSPARRWAVWRAVQTGGVRVVVGTRLAAFSPMADLGVIIIDHEEDASYKEERAPRYHARRVLEERARAHAAAVIWGTPTPSAEVLRDAAEGRARVISRPLHSPAIALSDVRAEAGPLGGLFGRRLYQTLARVLPRGRAILYVPRRGYADFLLCHECGWVPRCPRCGVAMTYHVRAVRLHCHLCSRSDPAPETCANCHGTHLRAHGVGTERVEQAARRLFRRASILRLDAERAPDEAAQQQTWAQFRKRGGLLVGTQLLVKGVGQVTADAVGVIGIDAALNLPDFRAAERVYQMLRRLAALAEREMIIQTFAPMHPALVALARGDAQRFSQSELAARERFGYPPYRTLVNVVAAGQDHDAVRDAAQAVADAVAEVSDAADILGPSPAPLARVRGRYRWQVLIKDDDAGAARVRLAQVMRTRPVPRDVRVLVDVDPLELL